jgi:hypothetical protein
LENAAAAAAALTLSCITTICKWLRIVQFWTENSTNLHIDDTSSSIVHASSRISSPGFECWNFVVLVWTSQQVWLLSYNLNCKSQNHGWVQPWIGSF